MRGSGWATDWPQAVRGLHELAHAAERPLRKGIGLIFLPAQEKQEIERKAATKWGPHRNGWGDGWGGVVAAVSCRAVPLRLATLASVKQRGKKHSRVPAGLRENLSMKEHQTNIFRGHIRVARNELPWVCYG